VVLLDIKIPGLSGIEAVLTAASLGVTVALLSMALAVLYSA